MQHNRPKLYVNVYLLDKEEGGPEEGGWYYDTWEVESSTKCNTVEEAKTQLEEVEREYAKENEGRPSISSVISKGRFDVRLEASPGESGNNYHPYC